MMTTSQDSAITQAEDRVATELDRLERSERITARDLERFRKSLPTEPFLAEAVSKALPFPLSELFEYVEGSDRQAAYWRVRPERSQPRSPADQEHKERFAAAARSAEGVSGTVEYQGREVPASAALVAEQIAGESASSGAASETGQLALARLRDLLE